MLFRSYSKYNYPGYYQDQDFHSCRSNISNYADRNNVLTKEAAFRKIHKRTGLPPSEILVVGDRPAREIRAGRELGMHTVRVRHGEFKSQLPVGPEEEPDYVVKSISEIRKLPFTWGAGKAS